MSIIEDLGQRLLGVTKALTLMEERHKRQEEDNKELRAEVAKLKDQISALTTRVALLEKGEEIIDAKLEAAIIKAVAFGRCLPRCGGRTQDRDRHYAAA